MRNKKKNFYYVGCSMDLHVCSFYLCAVFPHNVFGIMLVFYISHVKYNKLYAWFSPKCVLTTSEKWSIDPNLDWKIPYRIPRIQFVITWNIPIAGIVFSPLPVHYDLYIYIYIYIAFVFVCAFGFDFEWTCCNRKYLFYRNVSNAER